jgi:pyruvate formate lyase activating enzyme
MAPSPPFAHPHRGEGCLDRIGAVTGTVFDIRRFSVHDGPGIRTTVFLKGCPLRCVWCHNPEGLAAAPELVWRGERCVRCGACVAACPDGALRWNGDAPVLDAARCSICGACAEVCWAEARELVGRTMTAAAVLAVAERDRVFYEQSGGGVTVSGGEPLAQPAFLGALLAGCRARGLHTALDTSGEAPWEVLDRIRGLVDLFLYDLKLVSDLRHRRVTGVSNARILENLTALAGRGHAIVLRVPLVPGLTDDDCNVGAIGALAAELGIARVVVLPFHRLGTAKYVRLGRPPPLPQPTPPTDERVTEVLGALRHFGLAAERSG